MDHYKVMQAAINHYGKDNQVEKFKEELLELCLGLARDDESNILEEFADVAIMMEQYKMMLTEKQRNKIEWWFECKIARLNNNLPEYIK